MSSSDQAWLQTEVFVRLLRRVTNVLMEHDPMDIAQAGPWEYDLEASQIARLTMESAQSVDDVRGIVDHVFASYFWPGSGTRLELVADDVWNTYRELLARRAVKEPSRRALESRALEYVRDRLWLAATFASALDRHLQGGDWHAWTYADLDVPAERLALYDTGGHVFTGGSLAEQIGRIVRGRVRRLGGMWIVPDPLAKPTDLVMREIPHEHVDETVYYAETSTQAADLSCAWNNAASAAGAIGFVTAADHCRDVEALVADAHFIVLEAYDGDGAIYIERDRPTVTTPGPTSSE